MLLEYMADKYGLKPQEFADTVRKTCGLPNATPEEFAAFMMVAKEYDLNPILKEIYAFPKKGGGIVPIVSIDGWANLINSHGQLDGIEFKETVDKEGALISCTCLIYRKDRAKPVSVTEYYSECFRDTDPWKMKHRMLRHKALTQCARYAFGFSGIFDEDEGAKIAEAPEPVRRVTGPPPAPPAPTEPEKDATASSEPATGQSGENSGKDVVDAVVDEYDNDPEAVFKDAKEKLALANDAGDVEEIWSGFEHHQQHMFPPDWEHLLSIKSRRLGQIERQ